MRGRFQDQGGLFSYIRPEERIPADHPLREIRKLAREVMEAGASHKSCRPKDGSDHGDARTFTARGVRTTRIKPQAPRRPSSTAKRPGAKPSSAIGAMRSWRTATVLLLTAPSHRPAAPPSGVPLRRCSRRKPNDRDEESRSARTKPTTPAITLRRCAR